MLIVLGLFGDCFVAVNLIGLELCGGCLVIECFPGCFVDLLHVRRFGLWLG